MILLRDVRKWWGHEPISLSKPWTPPGYGRKGVSKPKILSRQISAARDGALDMV